MKKIVFIGDIHGRDQWKTILDREVPDFTIFLGDYVSTHENILSEEQIQNMEEILCLKESHRDSVVLLRGNHDLQHLGYWWAECSGLYQHVQRHLSLPEMRERFLSLTQWVHEMTAGGKKLLCSHAGVSQVWLERSGIGKVEDINLCEPDERFGFHPSRFSDHNGDSDTQPCTWIRPKSLAECAVEGYVHIVGHTPQRSVSHEQINDRTELWLVDALAYGVYLVLEDDKFTVKSLY